MWTGPLGSFIFLFCIYFGVRRLVAALSLHEIRPFVTVGIIPRSRICILDFCVYLAFWALCCDCAAVPNAIQCIDYDFKFLVRSFHLVSGQMGWKQPPDFVLERRFLNPPSWFEYKTASHLQSWGP